MGLLHPLPRGGCSHRYLFSIKSGVCARPRSSSPKLLLNPRSSGNDQANCFEEDFVPAAQLATQKLRINCKPSKTLGKPKINTAKEEHFPLESHGQGTSVSSGLVPRRQLRFIYCATHINVSLWLCCSLPTGEKKGPLFRRNAAPRAGKRCLGGHMAPPLAASPEPLPRARDRSPLHTGEDAASGKPEWCSLAWGHHLNRYHLISRHRASLGAQSAPRQQTARRVGNGSS